MREAITQDIDREVLGDPPNLAPKAKPSKPAKATAAPSPPKSSPKQPQADTAPTSATTQAASQEEVAMEEGEADARAKTPELADTPPPDATKAAAPAKSETRAERRARLRKEREAAEAKAPAPAEPGTEEDLESEDLAADVAAEGCKACGGTKKNSRGGPCRACQVREVPRSAGDEGPADGEDAEEPAVEGPDETPLVEHGADALDPQLVGASRLKHVLDFLMQNEGLEGEKELIERCKELQEKVPALERVGTNLDVRVKRTLAYVMKNK